METPKNAVWNEFMLERESNEEKRKTPESSKWVNFHMGFALQPSIPCPDSVI
jgi:hypothetical protein